MLDENVLVAQLPEHPKYPLEEYLRDFPNLKKVLDYKGMVIWSKEKSDRLANVFGCNGKILRDGKWEDM